MSSDNLPEEIKEDDEGTKTFEVVVEPQEPPDLQIEEQANLERVPSEKSQRIQGTEDDVKSQLSEKQFKEKSGDEIVQPIKSDTEAKVSVTGIDAKVLVIKKDSKAPIPAAGVKIRLPGSVDETIQGVQEPDTSTYPKREEAEVEGEKLPPSAPPEMSLKGESEESEEQDLFGEEPWEPCDEKPEPEPPEVYGEGDIEGEESSSEELGEEEEEEEPLDEKISMDSEYLKSSLGTPLTYALLDIIAKRPTDPIHYLGHYLIRWRANGETKDKYEKEVEVLTAERQLYMENLREKERQKMLEKEQKDEEYRRAGKMESSLEDDDESDDDEEEEDDVITQSEKGSVTLDD